MLSVARTTTTAATTTAAAAADSGTPAPSRLVYRNNPYAPLTSLEGGNRIYTVVSLDAAESAGTPGNPTLRGSGSDESSSLGERSLPLTPVHRGSVKLLPSCHAHASLSASKSPLSYTRGQLLGSPLMDKLSDESQSTCSATDPVTPWCQPALTVVSSSLSVPVAPKRQGGRANPIAANAAAPAATGAPVSVVYSRFLPPPPPPRMAVERGALDFAAYYHTLMRWYHNVVARERYYSWRIDYLVPRANLFGSNFHLWVQRVEEWWWCNIKTPRELKFEDLERMRSLLTVMTATTPTLSYGVPIPVVVGHPASSGPHAPLPVPAGGPQRSPPHDTVRRPAAQQNAGYRRSKGSPSQQVAGSVSHGRS